LGNLLGSRVSVKLWFALLLLLLLTIACWCFVWSMLNSLFLYMAPSQSADKKKRSNAACDILDYFSGVIVHLSTFPAYHKAS